MTKEAMFIKVGNIVFPDHTTEPKVVITVTKYKYGTIDYYYLEMQELFGTDIVRRSYPSMNRISALDPDEAARLYSLHKNGNQQPDPSKVVLTDHEKKVTSVTEGRRLLTINIHDIRVGDVVADVDGTPAGEVTEVVRGGQYVGHVFRYRSYADNEHYQEHRPKGTEINVYREM